MRASLQSPECSRRSLERAALSLALVLSGAGLASAQTVDEVVRSYVDARGGLQKLRRVEALRLRGTLELPGNPKAAYLLELKRPGKMRSELAHRGQRVVTAYDGSVAWSESTTGPAPELLDVEETAEAKAQADVDLSPLVDAVAKGLSVELAGRDRVPGRDTWRLIVRGGEQPPRTLYVDTHTHLVVRSEELRSVEGREVEFVTDIGDYRSQAGLRFPHLIEVGPKASAERQRLVIESIQVNPVLDDTRFAKPEP